MNIRNLYLVVIVFSSLGLLYEWNSVQKLKSIEEHMLSISSSEYFQNNEYVRIENEELALVISVSAGSIVESRLKKYSVENVDGSLGFRVFGSSVERNKIKRQVKEIFRSVLGEMPAGGIIVFSVFRPYGELSYKNASLEIASAVKTFSGELDLK